jgi:hypothetical protein
VIAALVTEVTAAVVMVKVAVLAPAATITVLGTVTDAEPLDRLITVPPAGATPVRVTVPVELVPPTTLFEASVTFDGLAEATVRAWLRV